MLYRCSRKDGWVTLRDQRNFNLKRPGRDLSGGTYDGIIGAYCDLLD